MTVDGPRRALRRSVASVRPDLRSLGGVLVGAGTAAIATMLASWSGELLAYTVLIVLAVGLVALVLGPGAALYAYAAAGIVIIVLSLLPRETSDLALAPAIQLGTFVLGTPILIVLALRAERDRQLALRAADRSEAAERRAYHEAAAAEDTRRELRSALANAERERSRLEEVAETIPEPLVVYDQDGIGTFANRAALRILGRSFFERRPEDWARVAAPRDDGGMDLAREDWPQLRAQTESVSRRMIVRVPMSGSDLLVDVEGRPIPGGGCLLLLRDVSREEDERRRLSRFASFVAHELRNPLAVAKARIELIGRVGQLPPPVARNAERALDSTDAAIGILERLELFSRADAGSVQAQLEPFDLASAVSASVERVRARGSERDIRIRMGSRPRVNGDRHFTEQAITNLLINADRYAEPGTPIDIEVSGRDPVVLRVRDAGPGITDELAERLFRDRLGDAHGLGLGLYLVHAVMRAQAGSVELERRRPGAVFALRWQRARRAAAEEPEGGSATPRG